jgi:hypothetical protein
LGDKIRERERVIGRAKRINMQYTINILDKYSEKRMSEITQIPKNGEK